MASGVGHFDSLGNPCLKFHSKQTSKRPPTLSRHSPPSIRRNPRSLHHVPDAITETMNEACAQLGDQRNDFVMAASRRLLRREKW